MSDTLSLAELFNFSIHDVSPTWWAIPTKAAPPIALPVELGGKGILYEQAGEKQFIVKYAIQNEVRLTVDQIKKCCAQLCIPGPATGSGKKGRVIKRDWAQVLIQHLFPEMPAAERTKLLDDLCGQPPVKDLESCPQEVLKVLKKMDPDNAICFAGLHKHVEEKVKFLDTEFGKKQQKECEERLQAHQLRVNRTPLELRCLIPDRPGLYLKRRPLEGWVQAVCTEGST